MTQNKDFCDCVERTTKIGVLQLLQFPLSLASLAKQTIGIAFIQVLQVCLIITVCTRRGRKMIISNAQHVCRRKMSEKILASQEVFRSCFEVYDPYQYTNVQMKIKSFYGTDSMLPRRWHYVVKGNFLYCHQNDV